MNLGRTALALALVAAVLLREVVPLHAQAATSGFEPLTIGTIDLLVWGAAQTGSWGELTHRAGAFATEAGWQPRLSLAPWIRGGFNYGSGDHNPTDGRHGTFFPVLPTPRLYARFPFFNMMNSGALFGELMLKPSRTASVRADIHVLRLADANDLWYQGGGAFQPDTFGYVGQPSHGQAGLATLYDGSADLTVTPRISVGLYYGYAVGGPVMQFLLMKQRCPSAPPTDDPTEPTRQFLQRLDVAAGSSRSFSNTSSSDAHGISIGVAACPLAASGDATLVNQQIQAGLNHFRVQLGKLFGQGFHQNRFRPKLPNFVEDVFSRCRNEWINW